MAIEKMIFLDLVGKRKVENNILEQLILTESLHLHLNYSEVYGSNFAMHKFMLNHFSNEPLEQVEIQSKNVGDNQCQCEKLEGLLVKLAKDFDTEIKVDKQYLDPAYNAADAEEDLLAIEEEIEPISQAIESKGEEINCLLGFKSEIKEMLGTDIDFTKLDNMHYMTYELGILSKENNARIKKNYENISALIWRVGKRQQEDVYLLLYPSQYKPEVGRILKSLNWSSLGIPSGLSGTPYDMAEQIDKRVGALRKEIQELQIKRNKNKEEFIALLNKSAVRVAMEKQIKYLKENIERDEYVFVVSGWVPKKDKELIDQVLATFGDKCVSTYREAEEIEEAVNPPTKLKNHKLFKPFETIVELYGLPAYNEFDPTLFLSITYWLMFGIMFGDIGQGFVFFAIGAFMVKKKVVEPAGDILIRLGASSMFFGLLYGSFFGLEDLPWLPHIIGSPLQGDNIPKVLIAGVVVGIIFLSISYILGIINAFRRQDIEEGIFGKNGIVGYLFFLNLVMTLVSFTGIKLLPTFATAIAMVVFLLIIVFKQPLARLVSGIKPLHKGDVSSYYVESGFETIETILSTLSNTISFIRVGAFALNHAGLFLAFMVMSQMTSNIVLQIFILLVGNIIILVLEGLIVFIQGLRLEYYEMFGKYFTGGGKPYNPIRLRD